MYVVTVEELDKAKKPVYYSEYKLARLDLALERYVTMCLAYKSSEYMACMDYDTAEVMLMHGDGVLDNRYFVNERYI